LYLPFGSAPGEQPRSARLCSRDDGGAGRTLAVGGTAASRRSRSATAGRAGGSFPAVRDRCGPTGEVCQRRAPFTERRGSAVKNSLPPAPVGLGKHGALATKRRDVGAIGRSARRSPD